MLYPYNCDDITYTYRLCRNCPTHLSNKCPIPISPLCLTSHFYVCAEIYCIMNIDVPAGVGAPHLTHTTNLFWLKPEAVLYWAPLITARNDTSIYMDLCLVYLNMMYIYNCKFCPLLHLHCVITFTWLHCSLLMWKIILKGPVGTPYENGMLLALQAF